MVGWLVRFEHTKTRKIKKKTVAFSLQPMMSAWVYPGSTWA
jgi:hypothetical protein